MDTYIKYICDYYAVNEDSLGMRCVPDTKADSLFAALKMS